MHGANLQQGVEKKGLFLMQSDKNV